jgi:hypothetical protein
MDDCSRVQRMGELLVFFVGLMMGFEEIQWRGF